MARTVASGALLFEQRGLPRRQRHKRGGSHRDERHDELGQRTGRPHQPAARSADCRSRFGSVWRLAHERRRHLDGRVRRWIGQRGDKPDGCKRQRVDHVDDGTDGGGGFSARGVVTAASVTIAATAHDVQITSATGDITVSVNAYRTLLGALNANVAGEQAGGRREINWDGVPATFTDNDLFPGTFFNVNSPRGVLFTTPGSAFRMSDNGYVDVNANYAGEFNAFSKPKLFTARGSTVVDVHFVVAGSNTPALVTGFGSVFADVGLDSSTTIQYFDAAGNLLATVKAPRRSDAAGSRLSAPCSSRRLSHECASPRAIPRSMLP